MPYADKGKQREYFRRKDAERFLERREDKNAKVRARYMENPDIRIEHLMTHLSGKRLPEGDRKRPFLGYCELCGVDIIGGRKKSYHHWDDELPAMGVWLCYLCHKTAEGVEDGKVDKYLERKTIVEKEYAIGCLEKIGLSEMVTGEDDKE